MCTHTHACLYVVCRLEQWVEAVLGMAGRGALLSVKRKVFFLQLFKMDMFTQSIYLKKNKQSLYFLFIIPDILRQ